MSPGYHPYQTLQLAEAWEHSPHLRAALLPGLGGAALLSKPEPEPLTLTLALARTLTLTLTLTPTLNPNPNP